MRILKLSIENFKKFKPKLENLNLDSDLKLLIGINGSGKSSVLEAVALIFSEVKEYCLTGEIKERKIDGFEIQYSFNKSSIIETTSTTQNSELEIRHIKLSSSIETDLLFSISINEGEIITDKEVIFKYLPDNLIFYYAGFCETLQNIMSNTETAQANRFYSSRNNYNNILKEELSKNIIYINKKHFPLLFLLNFIDKNTNLPFSNSVFDIHSINLILKKPILKGFDNNNYKNLYNVQGFLKEYLVKLLIHSQPIELFGNLEKAKIEIEYHRGIIEALEDISELDESIKYKDNRFYLFHIFSLLYKIGMLDEIVVFIKDANGNSFNINDLSEGEQQLITVEAIKTVLCKDNTVLFLDEPDAFLHPKRQREIIPHIKKIFSESYVQIIATTHSPFVAQSVPQQSIVLFNKNGKVSRNSNEKLASYSAITDELFSIKSEFSIEVEDDFELFRKFRTKILNDLEYDVEELKILINKLYIKGDEIAVIMNREINQIQRLKGNIFSNG